MASFIQSSILQLQNLEKQQTFSLISIFISPTNKYGLKSRHIASQLTMYITAQQLSVALQQLGQLTNSQKSPLLVLDMRQKYEYDGGHIIGAKNIDWRQIDRITQLSSAIKNWKPPPKVGATIILYCEYGGKRSPEACNQTKKALKMSTVLQDEQKMIGHYPVYVLRGGYKGFWEKYDKLIKGGYTPQ